MYVRGRIILWTIKHIPAFAVASIPLYLANEIGIDVENPVIGMPFLLFLIVVAVVAQDRIVAAMRGDR